MARAKEAVATGRLFLHGANCAVMDFRSAGRGDVAQGWGALLILEGLRGTNAC